MKKYFYKQNDTEMNKLKQTYKKIASTYVSEEHNVSYKTYRLCVIRNNGSLPNNSVQFDSQIAFVNGK